MKLARLSAAFWTLPLVLGCKVKVPAPATSVTLAGSGYSVQVSASPFSLQIVDASGAVKLATVPGDGPRATFNIPTYQGELIPGWDGYVPNELPWQTAPSGTLTQDDPESVTLELDGGSAAIEVTVQVVGTRVLYTQRVTENLDSFNKSALAFQLTPDSHFFGMGERYAEVDHLGQSLYSWPEEGGLGGGEDAGPSPTNPYPNGPSMTYFPVPFFHTTHGVSVLVNTDFRSEVHFGTDVDAGNTWRVAVDDSALALTFYVRDSPLDAIADYTEDTGRAPLPAPWAWGPRRRIDRGATVDGGPEWMVMRQLHLPITTIDDAMHVLPADSQVGMEDTLRAWTQELHDEGYKVVDYNNPYVAASAPASADDYAYGEEHGYFEAQPDGGPATSFFISGAPLTVSAIDLTSLGAMDWFGTMLQRSVDLGYDGWMHDFGEYVARSSHFSNGMSGLQMHNLFPRYSVEAGRLYALTQRLDQINFFVRSGYIGSQAYATEVWGGDPEASFDNTQGLPAMLRGGMNLGMVGVPYWGSDMGGFKCITNAPHDKEMLVRWYELGAVSPMMHDENACSNPVSGDQVKWTLWDDLQTQAIYQAMASLHTRLAPYNRALAVVAHTTGLPLMRHPFLLYPTMSDAWAVDDSFFLGPSLYAAPVAHRGLTSRAVWFPPGQYLDWDDRTLYQGPAWITVPAPLATLPLFLVQNQLVPLLDASVQTLAPSADPTVVTEESMSGVLDVVASLTPGGQASLTLNDGTVLTARRLGSDPGNPQGLAAATDATLPTCALCGVVDTSGDVARVRLNGASAASSAVQLSDVSVAASGGPARLVRWEVLELP